MITFGLPWLLALLPLPWLVRHLLPAAKPAQSAALRVPFFAHLAARAGGATRGTPRTGWMRWVVISAAWLLLVISAARPQWLGPARAVPTEGRDLMLAVDVSGSMAQEDFTASGRAVDRLAVVRAVRTSSSAIGRATASAWCCSALVPICKRRPPPTWRQCATSWARPKSAWPERRPPSATPSAWPSSTCASAPRATACWCCSATAASNAGVLDPMLAADLAKKEGVRVHTIGVGADRMAVNTVFGTQVVDPSADLDEKTLAAIAEMTGGHAFRAKSTEGLVEVYRQIDELEPTEGDELFVRPEKQLFHWPLAAAFALSAAYAASTILRPGRSSPAAGPLPPPDWRTA